MASHTRPPAENSASPAGLTGATGLKGGDGIDRSNPLASVSVTRTDLRTGPRLTRAQHRALVERTAYYFAERRGFIGGHEGEDWSEAENLVVSRYGIPVIE